MRRKDLQNFNTSYVTVQLFVIFCTDKYLLFQYILCYGSTNNSISTIFQNSHFNTSYVTVQPYYLRRCTYQLSISIHPMLRFNTSQGTSLNASSRISIHPMLRFNHHRNLTGYLNPSNFNTSYVTVQHHCDTHLKEPKKFQYILCYGSTDVQMIVYFVYLNFNTSYVTVQHCCSNSFSV